MSFASAMTADDITQHLRMTFPQAVSFGFTIGSVAPMMAELNLKPQDHHLRPGNTVSGPTLMTLADTAAYLAILATVGIERAAHTASLNISFLKKATHTPLQASATLLHLGQRQAVVSVDIFSIGNTNEDSSLAAKQLTAHATVTYVLT